MDGLDLSFLNQFTQKIDFANNYIFYGLSAVLVLVLIISLATFFKKRKKEEATFTGMKEPVSSVPNAQVENASGPTAVLPDTIPGQEQKITQDPAEFKTDFIKQAGFGLEDRSSDQPETKEGIKKKVPEIIDINL